MKTIFLIIIAFLFHLNAKASTLLEINDQIKIKVTEVTPKDSMDRFFVLDQDFHFQNENLRLNIPQGTCLRKASGFNPMRRGDGALAPQNSYSFHQRLKPDCRINLSTAEDLGYLVQVNLDSIWKKAYAHFDKKMQLVGAAIKDVGAFYIKVPSVQGVEFTNDFPHVGTFAFDTFKGTKYYQFYNIEAGTTYHQELADIYNQEAHIYSIIYKRNLYTSKYEAVFFESGSVFDLPVKGGQKIVFVGWDSDRYGECEYEFGENLVVIDYKGTNCLITP